MPNPDDKLTDIPSIIAQRDDVRHYSRPRGEASEARSARKPTDASGSSSGFLKFCAVGGFLVAVLGVGAAAFLYQQAQTLGVSLQQANQRIADLEGRLSSTDDSVNQSSAVMQVKIKELDSEVRKLWASAWQKNKGRIDALEAQQKKGDESARKQLSTLAANQDKLQKTVAANQDLSITLEAVKEQQGSHQTAITRLGSTMNSLSNTQRAQEARLKETEQWVQSNIEFRKQVTQRLTRLENPASGLPVE